MGVTQARRVQHSSLSRGLLLRRHALGGSATYRVLAARGPLVYVEVVDAPGLAPGTTLRLTAAAAAAMVTARAEALDAPRGRIGPAAPRGVRAIPRIG